MIDLIPNCSPEAGLFNIQNWVAGQEKAGNPNPLPATWGLNFPNSNTPLLPAFARPNPNLNPAKIEAIHKSYTPSWYFNNLFQHTILVY